MLPSKQPHSYGYTSLVRARRKEARLPVGRREEYVRHKWLVEGRHGEAKTQHGLSRASRRGLEQVAIQVYMTAIAMNLKRLAASSNKALIGAFSRVISIRILFEPFHDGLSDLYIIFATGTMLRSVRA